MGTHVQGSIFAIWNEEAALGNSKSRCIDGISGQLVINMYNVIRRKTMVSTLRGKEDSS